jgi:hypothetical protein
VHELSDEELLAAIAAGPGFLPEFYRRHVATVTGVGVRRFSRPEDVADSVANLFLEVMGSAGGCGGQGAGDHGGRDPGAPGSRPIPAPRPAVRG